MLCFKLIFLYVLAISYVRGHSIGYWNHGNYLSPVQGLYVRPSTDGTTGDLYVAASEDNGVKQWLTDKPVNFLPTAHHQVIPTSYAAQLPHEDIVVSTQKRAVLTHPSIKYSYTYPGVPEGTPTSYPYAITVTSSTKPAETTTECSEGANSAPASPAYPQYAPFQYYYPQMLAAFAHAMNSMKEAGTGQGDLTNASKVPAWPSYAYPAFQYVMVDPSSWAQSQTQTQTQSAPAASPSLSESATSTDTPANSNEIS